MFSSYWSETLAQFSGRLDGELGSHFSEEFCLGWVNYTEEILLGRDQSVDLSCFYSKISIKERVL